MPIANKIILAPGAWVRALAEVSVAVAEAKGVTAPVSGISASDTAKRVAASLLSGRNKAFCWQRGRRSPPSWTVASLGAVLCAQTGATFGYLGAAATALAVTWRMQRLRKAD